MDSLCSDHAIRWKGGPYRGRRLCAGDGARVSAAVLTSHNGSSPAVEEKK